MKTRVQNIQHISIPLYLCVYPQGTALSMVQVYIKEVKLAIPNNDSSSPINTSPMICNLHIDIWVIAPAMNTP